MHSNRLNFGICLNVFLAIALWQVGLSRGQQADDLRSQDSPQRENSVAAAQDGSASQEDSAKSPSTAIALTGARILTYDSGGTVESGSILIVDGVIRAVGPEIEIPENARRIDCSGLTIAPGLIDARSRLWLDTASAAQSGSAASLDVFDGIDPYSEDWRDVVCEGVTSVYLQPATGDTCGGFGAVVATAPVTKSPVSSGSVTVIKREAGLQAALGVGSNQTGRARVQQFDRLKKLFTDAKAYQEEWKVWNEYEAKKAEESKAAEGADSSNRTADGDRNDAEGEQSGEGNRRESSGDGRSDRPGGGRRGFGGRRGPPNQTGSPTESGARQETPTAAPEKTDESKPAEEKKPPTKPKQDPIKDRLVKVLTGEIPVHMTVKNVDDAKRAIELGKEFGWRLVLDGMSDSEAVSADLIDAKYPLVLGPWAAVTKEAVSAQRIWGMALDRIEGRFAIASFSANGRSSGGLRAHAAHAVAYGCDPERALAAVTIDAARILGIADQTGSIATGKRADLAIFSGDPLDIASSVRMTIVGGEIVFEAKAETRPTNALTKESALSGLPRWLPDRYTLTSARVMGRDGGFAPGVIAIENGTIVALNESDGRPDNGPTYDLGDAVITPGFFAAHTSIGISSVDFRANESDARHLFAADSFNPTDRQVGEMVQSGVLTALVAPPSQNTLAGRIALVRTGSGDPIAVRDVGDKFVLSANGRSRDKFPSVLGGQRELVRSLLTGESIATRVYLPDSALTLLAEVRAAGTSDLAAGKRLAVFEAASDLEVRTALDLIEKHQLNAAIFGIENVNKFVDSLAATKTRLIVGELNDTVQSWKFNDLIGASEAGVPLWWTGESGWHMRRSAGMAITRGLDPKVAMAGLAGPRIGDGVFRDGVFRDGDDAEVPSLPADLVIWSGVPYDLRAKPLAIIVDGQRVADKREREKN